MLSGGFMDYKCGFKFFDLNKGDDSSRWSEETLSPGIITKTSPVITTDFPARECICSWNVVSGFNGWTEIFLRARILDKWTTWYRMGVWSPVGSFVSRFSIEGQNDENGSVATDTLLLKQDADAFQISFRLCETRTGGMPLLKRASLSWNSRKPASFTDLKVPGLQKIVIENVPCHSQMEYKDGGNSWCSPTSVSMVIEYWLKTKTDREILVREAVSGTYDPVYKGNGNWSFNAAWAGSKGFTALVRRFSCLEELIPLLKAQIPVVMSVSWNNEMDRVLDNSPVSSSNGHLTVLRGFDGEGNALMNEPASPCDKEVQRKYPCHQLQQRWLEASGGVCYLIFPQDQNVLRI
jgi:hypothetical protein